MTRFNIITFILLLPFFLSAQSSCIVINEYVVDPKNGNNGDADATGEFIELYNKCNCAVDISCYVLCITDNSSGRRGDCITIPNGSSIPAGGVYVLGGYGTNCTGGVTTCDWPGLTLNFNWHSNATSVWNVVTNSFYTTNVGNYIGVVADGGEDLSLFDNTGAFIYGVYADGGAGVTTNNTENIGAISGCGAKSITIPPTSSHINVGTTPGAWGADGGFRRNCDNTWTAVQMAGETPSTPLVCTLVSCVLPIELISFDAENNGNTNVIKWKTATETNNKYFSIERSANAIDFYAIGQVNGAGNSGILKNYSFPDNNPINGIAYYRLKQVDFDGNFKYSNIVSVENINTNENKLTIAPNPADNEIMIYMDCGSSTEEVVNIYDNKGNIVLSKIFTCSKGDNKTYLDIKELSSGIYMVLVSVENKFYKTRFIKN